MDACIVGQVIAYGTCYIRKLHGMTALAFDLFYSAIGAGFEHVHSGWRYMVC